MQASDFIFIALGILTARLLLPFTRSTISPLRSVPGPFLARLSNIYYFLRVRKGTFHHENIALHREYGPIVRVGPNHYSIDDPSMIKPVYGIGSKMPKSEWYEGWKHPDPARFTIFTEQNVEMHARTRRLFQSMYAMSSLVTYEAYVDDCAEIFSTRLMDFAASGRVIDMGHWFTCYAFDVIGEITYSERFGFLDAGEDIAGTLQALERSMRYSTLVGVYASWHPWIYAVMDKFPGSGAAGRTYLMQFVQQHISRRKLERSGSANLKAGAREIENVPEDFLSKMLQAREQNPEKVTDYHVFMMGLANIIAGSDTTSVSLSAILYYLLKNPRTLQKLRDEIEDFEKQGRLVGTVKFREAQDMPYFQAVMKEALRLHAATGLPLWRVVPEGGAHLSGRFFPAGTVIGVNTWVAHYNEAVFGKDAHVFRPERWLEAEAKGGDALKNMDAYYMPFGLGSRTCLGRHISVLEMSKLIPQIVRKFDFELEDPEREWRTENYWFVKPADFRLRVKLRQETSG